MPEAGPYRVHNAPLKCLVCGHQEFESRRFLLNTRGLTFMNWDWANKDAAAAICTRCRFVHWFADGN
jgi:hypothetical protein